MENTKRRIQTLVREISDLSRRIAAPEQFFAEFLPRVVAALAAIGGAVWTKDRDGRIVLRYQVNVRRAMQIAANGEHQIRHARLLYQAFEATGSYDGMLVPPGSSIDDDQTNNPTPYLLVIAPLRNEHETVGIVEIFQRTEAAPNVQMGYLRFLNQMCQIAADGLPLRRSQSNQ